MQKFELGMPIPLTTMLRAQPQNNNWACEIQVISIKMSPSEKNNKNRKDKLKGSSSQYTMSPQEIGIHESPLLCDTHGIKGVNVKM